jgi:hypothetical protein
MNTPTQTKLPVVSSKHWKDEDYQHDFYLQTTEAPMTDVNVFFDIEEEEEEL